MKVLEKKMPQASLMRQAVDISTVNVLSISLIHCLACNVDIAAAWSHLGSPASPGLLQSVVGVYGLWFLSEENSILSNL